jgi:hypothetical protein
MQTGPIASICLLIGHHPLGAPRPAHQPTEGALGGATRGALGATSMRAAAPSPPRRAPKPRAEIRGVCSELRACAPERRTCRAGRRTCRAGQRACRTGRLVGALELGASRSDLTAPMQGRRAIVT